MSLRPTSPYEASPDWCLLVMWVVNKQVDTPMRTVKDLLEPG